MKKKGAVDEDARGIRLDYNTQDLCSSYMRADLPSLQDKYMAGKYCLNQCTPDLPSLQDKYMAGKYEYNLNQYTPYLHPQDLPSLQNKYMAPGIVFNRFLWLYIP